VGNPTVFVRAEDVNKLLNKNIISGYDNKIEDPLALDLLENIRCAGACKMGLGENP
jgi:hypothetical protein